LSRFNVPQQISLHLDQNLFLILRNTNQS
jgi:hypothetical protein